MCRTKFADSFNGRSRSFGIEVYKNKLILYGCGDFLNDYEGIGGEEDYRGDLSLMYFAKADPAAGNLVGLRMAPTQIKKFRVNRAPLADARFLAGVLNREGKKFGTGVRENKDGSLSLVWK